jgi:hypothetical protein
MKLKKLGRIGSISKQELNGCDVLLWRFKGVALQIDTGSPITILRRVSTVRCTELEEPQHPLEVSASSGKPMYLDNVSYKGIRVWQERSGNFLDNYPKEIIGIVGLDYIPHVIKGRKNKFLKLLGN